MVFQLRQNKKKTGVWLPPTIGYDLGLVIKLLRKNRVIPFYYPRIIAILLINIINMPFRWYERTFINPRINRLPIQEAPVFIIGHWRSGTTHLHNLLCQDPRMGYVTTYQSVFPDSLFTFLGRFIFKNFMRLLIDPKRKGDNVLMNADYPQEEEFTLGSRIPVSYYYFWMFPERALDFYDQSIEFKGIDPNLLKKWYNGYSLVIKKALKNIGASRYLSKNPSHTGRVATLLKLFPTAKFIHIHRNPVLVYLSTRHFFQQMGSVLRLQRIPDHLQEEIIFTVYDRIIHKYLDERRQIPPENLIELSFDDLQSDPLNILERIYTQFGIPDFEQVKGNFSGYLQQSKGYKKNVHHISKDLLDKILQRWDFAMKEWGYDLPRNIVMAGE